MQVAVKDQQDAYRPYFPLEEHVGKATIKADKQVTRLDEKGSLICNQKFVAQTIENLLPDEEDLFSGVLDELGHTATGDEDDEDFDLFNRSGGMELEGNSKLYFQRLNSKTAEGLNSDQSSSDYLTFTEHPSRTLLVKNVDNRVEDSELRVLFEHHGDIQTFYTSCRCQGFVIISYYDIRAATIAFSTLQNKPLENEKLHIHYSYPKDGPSGQYIDQASLEVYNCDSSISNDKLHQIFGSFGEIQEIYGTTHHRRIKFYDIRAAEAASNGLNNNNMLQEQIEVSHPEHGESLKQQYTPGLVQGQLRSSQNPNGKSLLHGMYITYDPVNSGSVGFRMETNDKHLRMLGPYGPPMEHMFKGTGNSLLDGHHHAWICSNSFHNHYHNPNPVIWSHSSPFNNGVSSIGTSNLPALSEIPPPVLYTVSPIHTQNVTKSAPSGSLSCKNLQIAHMEESFKVNSLLNPLRVVGFPSTICPPQIISHKSPFTFNRPRGRVRRISHGRHESISCHTDEKKYELDIERVLCGEDCRTTLMIKNIPNKYSSAMLLAAINEQNQGTYDFIYLPLDFKNKCNMGYAFINMIDPLKILEFHKSFNGQKWEKFHSGKVACLAYARIQGKDALIAHFQQSSLMNQDKCCHPILFTTDGPNAGNQEPFPVGPSIHSRRHKNGCNGREVNQNQEI